MREILFRGKRLQGENWVEGYLYKSDINKRERESRKATLIFTPDCDTFIYMPEAHNSVMIIAETVGQYTGLTDKNGRKIFEGDIVGGYDAYCNKTVEGIVCFDDGSFYVRDANCLSYFRWMDYELKVIGNIYDDPELQ